MDKEFSFERFTAIVNPDFRFYKVKINNKSFFDEFEKGLTQKSDKTSLASIYNLMSRLRKNQKLPSPLFRHIKPNNKGDRDDIYEFKKNNVRVYAALLPNGVFVLLGGLKKNQDADIAKVFKHFNQMPNS